MVYISDYGPTDTVYVGQLFEGKLRPPPAEQNAAVIGECHRTTARHPTNMNDMPNL